MAKKTQRESATPTAAQGRAPFGSAAEGSGPWVRLRWASGEDSVERAELAERPRLRQLELFPETAERRVVQTPADVMAELSAALEQGRTVGLVRAAGGFELWVAGGSASWRPVGRCGFSRRAVELLVRGVSSEERGLWARPAGEPWVGWTEWGKLTS